MVRPGARLTVAARIVVAAFVGVALVGRGDRPGALLRHPPAVVADTATPVAASRHRVRRSVPALLRGRARRARNGERVLISATAYCLGGSTRQGNEVRPGIIAADPRVFPLARHVDLFIGSRYFGRYLVDDTGKDIKGNRVDVWTESCRDARRFGRRAGYATLVQRGDDAPGDREVGPDLR